MGSLSLILLHAQVVNSRYSGRVGRIVKFNKLVVPASIGNIVLWIMYVLEPFIEKRRGDCLSFIHPFQNLLSTTSRLGAITYSSFTICWSHDEQNQHMPPCVDEEERRSYFTTK